MTVIKVSIRDEETMALLSKKVLLGFQQQILPNMDYLFKEPTGEPLETTIYGKVKKERRIHV